MFHFFKKLNHPVVDVIIMIALLIIILVSCNQVGHAAAPEREKKPMIAITSLMEKVGCVDIIEEFDDREEFLNYKAFSCWDKNGRKVYGENFVSVKRQARDLTEWELYSQEYGIGVFWMARCRGYNVFPIHGTGKVYVKQFVKKNKGCSAQRIDGRTYGRKVS